MPSLLTPHTSVLRHSPFVIDLCRLSSFPFFSSSPHSSFTRCFSSSHVHDPRLFDGNTKSALHNVDHRARRRTVETGTKDTHSAPEETRTEQTADARRELGDEKVGEDLVVALDSGSVDVQLPLVAKTSHTET